MYIRIWILIRIARKRGKNGDRKQSKKGKEKNRRKRQNKGFALSISYSYTQRFKGNSRDKTKKKRIRTGKKETKREQGRSKESCTATTVRLHCFELGGGTNNTFRRSKSRCRRHCHVWCISYVVVYVTYNSPKGEDIHPKNRVRSSYSKKKKHSISISTSISNLHPLAPTSSRLTTL